MSLPRIGHVCSHEENGRSVSLFAIHFGEGIPTAGLVLLLSDAQRLAVAQLYQVATSEKPALTLAIEAYHRAQFAIITAPKGTP